MLRIPFRFHHGDPGCRLACLGQSATARPLSGGTDISVQEAVDLLHKLREESVQVQAIYAGSGGVSSVFRGIVRPPIENGLWSIVSLQDTAGSALSFDLNLATERRFGDESSMSGAVSFPFRFHFVSALSFGFGDGSTLFLFELGQDQTAAYR
jgi:hypothetical protein